ncbi:hypothetical protein EV360DRAFT_86637 [Lentinula raphanica]|nr:hypothetical protein EV360DRAFT_86637 [Lentinula raphanica]
MGSRKIRSPKKTSSSNSPTRVARRRVGAIGPHVRHSMNLRRDRATSTVAPLGSSSGTNLSPTLPFAEADSAGGSSLTPDPVPGLTSPRRTPTPIIHQNATGASRVMSPSPEPLTSMGGSPTPMIHQDATTTFQLEVHRFETRSDTVIAEQLKALELLKEKEAVLQKKCSSIQQMFEQDVAARKRIHECPLCSDLAWGSHDAVIPFAFDV